MQPHTFDDFYRKIYQLLESHLMVKLAGNDKIDKIFMFMKTFDTLGYIHVYGYSFQTSSLKPLGSSTQNMRSLLGKGGGQTFV